MNYTKGAVMTIAGIILLMIAVALTSYAAQKNWHNYLLVMLQPAGWFLSWSGMEKILFGGKQTKIKKEFYHRLSKAKVEFVSI